MEKDIILSYILPCYNTGSFVRQCIESLYRQGMDESDFEVIFVNNATKDNSEDILQDINKYHSNIKYVKLKTNIFSGGAYNSGLNEAKGRYVQFVDSDDYIKDNVMKGLISDMEVEGLDLLYFNIESFRNGNVLTKEDNLLYNGNFSSSFFAERGDKYLLKAFSQLPYNCFPVPAYRKLIRRKLLIDNKICFTHSTIGCDYLHNLILLSNAEKIKVTTERVYMFRYNPNGVTKSRISSEAIIFAINNYGEAYCRLKNLTFEKDNIYIVSKDLCNLINTYIGAMKWLSSSERNDVISSIQYETITKSLVNGFLNMKLLENSMFSRLFLNSSLFVALRAILKK